MIFTIFTIFALQLASNISGCQFLFEIIERPLNDDEEFFVGACFNFYCRNDI